MAPLYKRYIPPKTSTSSYTAPVKPVPKAAPLPTQDEAPKKRKRERTDEEIAERKAKKLRKKGIDPATVSNTASAQVDAPATSGTINGNSNLETSNTSNTVDGEFAHVKNTKKRHKLEKAARKARKTEADAQLRVVSGSEPVQTNGDRSPHNVGPGQDGDVDAANSRSEKEESSRKKIRDGGEITHKRSGADSPGKWSSTAVSGRSEARKSSHDSANAVPQNNVQDASRGMDQSDSLQSQPKKRRHKLESILKGSQTETPVNGDDNDDHLRKHEGVMHKFQKSKTLSEMTPKSAQGASEKSADNDPVILDLGPLPQPDKAPTPEFVPDPSALPEWLSKPTVVSNDNKRPFKELKLDPKVVEHLSKLGFKDSMPVQEVLIPLLLPPGTAGAHFLPGTESILSDVAVGAPTGSGKTIAYLLPIIESLKKTAGLGRLKALIVVPTRELLMQVAAVADSLARGSGLKIGMVTGTGNFKDEQNKLVKKGRRYDPAKHRNLLARAHQRNYPPASDSDDFVEYLKDVESQDPREAKRIEDAVSCLADHVPTYESAVDILVATPGRLLEHLGVTLGFNLAYLEWLILDEADKLIDQQYHGFLDAINKELERPHTEREQDAREKYLRSKGCWNEQRERRVRKVMLSATMTRDISKLVDLKLRRPQLVVVRGQDSLVLDTRASESIVDVDRQIGAAREVEGSFELPPTLQEYCVHVGDGSEKPLYLAELLQKEIFVRSATLEANGQPRNQEDASDVSDIDPSLSDSTSSRGNMSDVDAASYQESNAGDTFENELDERDIFPQNNIGVELAMHPERTAMLENLSLGRSSNAAVPTVLIFSASTEAANRLSHLLKKLHPWLTSAVHTMTAEDKKRNPFFKVKASEPIIVVSTDRAARGLDTIADRPITHVVQYDVPRSATGYVHRVGRTARASKSGEAWTLFTHSEARWFLNEVAKAKSIKRAQPVEKIKLQVPDQASREKLNDAVVEMRDEVYGSTKGSAKR